MIYIFGYPFFFCIHLTLAAQRLAHLPGGDEPRTQLARLFRPALTKAEAQRKPGQVLPGLAGLYDKNIGLRKKLLAN
jgi:hypothetical protein